MNDMESADDIFISNNTEFGNEQMPFVCGYCNRQFDKISPYCLHIKDHNVAADDSFHICDDLDGNHTKFVYRCKKCRMEFPSVCLLHSHMLFCSGSYVYDHEHTMAFPIEDLHMFIKGRSEEATEKEKLLQNVLIDLNDKRIAETTGDIPNRCDNTTSSSHKEENWSSDGEDTKIKVEDIQTDEACLKDESENTVAICASFPQILRVKGKPENGLKNVREARLKNKAIKAIMECSRDIDRKKINAPRYVNRQPHRKRVWTTRYSSSAEGEVRSSARKRTVKKSKEKLKAVKEKPKKENQCEEKPKKEYHCEVCGKVCADNRRLKHHMISHSDVRSFVCEICSASYKYPNHLKVHMKSHSEVKPFCCELCGDGFIELQRLKAHKIHKHTTDRKHQCSECGISFKFKAGLNRHLLNHTSEKLHQCEVCGQQFSRKYYLVQHMWIHTNTRRFECDRDGCRRKFFTNYQLQCHLKIHSGERPYKCALCPREFIQRKELRRHLKKRHGRNLEAMEEECEDVSPESAKREKTELPPDRRSDYVQYLPSTSSVGATGSLVIADVGMIMSDGTFVSHIGLGKSDGPHPAFRTNESVSQDSKEFSLNDLDSSSVEFLADIEEKPKVAISNFVQPLELIATSGCYIDKTGDHSPR